MILVPFLHIVPISVVSRRQPDVVSVVQGEVLENREDS